jgi:serine protease inhibitor ecotin
VKNGDVYMSNGKVQVSQGSFHLYASTAGGGLTVMLDSAELDSELAQLGLGNSMDDSQLIGVEYDYKSLLTVGAPMMTMADLMGSDGKETAIYMLE